MPNEMHLDKKKLRELLNEANELKALYDEANRNGTHYNYGSVDEIALRLLERREFFVTIDIKAHYHSAKIYGRVCYPGSDSFIALDGQTVEYVLDGIQGTTIARFVRNVCDIINQRVNNGNSELKEIMASNAKAHSNRTREYIKPYLPRQ